MENNNNKLSNSSLAIMLALITSFTSLGTALINRSSSDEKSVKDVANIEEIVKAIKIIDERSLLSYLALAPSQLERAKLILTMRKDDQLKSFTSLKSSGSNPFLDVSHLDIKLIDELKIDIK